MQDPRQLSAASSGHLLEILTSRLSSWPPLKETEVSDESEVHVQKQPWCQRRVKKTASLRLT